AIDERDLDVEDGVAGEDAAFERFLCALLHRVDVLPRHRTADDLVFELEALAAFERLNLEFDNAVLAAPARLADEPALGARLLGDRFAVAHLRAADVRGHLMLAQHAIDDDFQMEFAHPG